MAGGAPGSSSRGRGGKFKKYTRGGGHHFSRNLQPLDAEGNAVSIWSVDKEGKKDGDDDDDDSEEDEEDEEEDSDEEDPAAAAAKEEASREARKAQKKARKEAAIARSKAKTVEVGDMPTSDEEEEDDDDDDDMPANPNHSKAARKQALAPRGDSDEEGEDADVDEITSGVKKIQAGNRKEREAIEAAAAKERYMKMQAQGKTDEAKADLARLKVIREQRAAEAARRQAEKEERDAQEKEKRAQIEAREAKKREAAAGPKKSKKK